jgi:hypothetical protein
MTPCHRYSISSCTRRSLQLQVFPDAGAVDEGAVVMKEATRDEVRCRRRRATRRGAGGDVRRGAAQEATRDEAQEATRDEAQEATRDEAQEATRDEMDTGVARRGATQEARCGSVTQEVSTMMQAEAT